MVEDCSGRTFQRTIINNRPFRATKNPPPPHHDLVSAAALLPQTLIAVRDTPDSSFHLAQVLSITESHLSVQYLGTTTPNLETAVFHLVWIATDGRTVLKDSLAKLTPPTSPTSWLHPTLSSTLPVVSLANPHVSSSIFVLNSTFTDCLARLHLQPSTVIHLLSLQLNPNPPPLNLYVYRFSLSTFGD
jgi:hypothetical protein